MSSPLWQPDLGNGRCRNPVLYADYSDPDVIRVGEDFYLTASSFTCMPTLPILHSKDLVNWTIIGHAADGLPLERYRKPVHGEGTWAPSLRYHDGRFYIYVCSPEDGLWRATADNPAGPWNIELIEAVGKWEDPCPFWDDDGNAYLVRSKVGAGALYMHRMNSDGSKILDNGVIIAQDPEKLPTIEGPKMYKRDGMYYILVPIGGVSKGQQAVLRSRDIYGPYEHRQVLHQGSTAINGPHQGGLVDTASGQWWFMHFQATSPYGRVVHLQPVEWKDGWPIMGEDIDSDGIGEPVLEHAKPDVGCTCPIAVPQTSDEFDSEKLGLQWQWNANVDRGWYSLSANPGNLRLYSVKNFTRDGDLLYVPNVLLQKFPAPAFSATTKVVFKPQMLNERCGLVVFGTEWRMLALEKAAEDMRLILYYGPGDKRLTGCAFERSAAWQGNSCYMRVNVNEGGMCQFSTSLDGMTFESFGEPFKAANGHWIGAKVGICCLSVNIPTSTGYADFAHFSMDSLR
jgi:beta-xylosidase